MKTKVRIQEHRRNSNNGYITKSIQILIQKFKDSDLLEPIGVITFQRNADEDHWYAMRFVIDTDDVSYIRKMANIASAIKKSAEFSWEAQPDDILRIIGAVEYKVFQSEFVPVSKDGQIMYDVIQYPGSLHSRIIAPDDKTANKLLKRKKLDKAFIKINCQVVLA